MITEALKHRPDTVPDTVADILTTVMDTVRPAGPCRWAIGMRGLTGHARLDEDFLCLATTLGRADADEWCGLLRINGSLGGLVKYGIDFDRTLHLQAELPLGADVPLHRRLTAVREGFLTGASAWKQPGATGVVPDLRVTAAASGPDLEHLCQEAGWPYVARKSGGFTVSLPALQGGRPALVEARDGRVHITCGAGILDDPSPDGRRATAGLLLAAARRLRLARASLDEDDGGITARLEVVYEPTPSPVELSSAFEALTTGLNLCASEVDVFGCPDSARNFLSSFAAADGAAREA